MAYLIASDYNRLIQDVSLQQIISGNSAIVTLAERTALEEIQSYLIQKYDTSKEFTDTTLFNPAATYKAGNRVYIDASAYSASSTYILTALVLQAGKIYMCKTAITVPEAFTISKWTLIGNQYDLFYVAKPAPDFDLQSNYPINYTIFYKDHTYKSLVPTAIYDHQTMIQFVNSNEVPYQNIFPDDPKYGLAYWSDQGVFSLAGTTITDITKFTPGDNRSQQMIMYMLDMVIFHLYSRIPPQIIPQNRIDRYGLAISWLKGASKGTDITPNLPKYQPPTGNRIRSGTNIKQTNSY